MKQKLKQLILSFVNNLSQDERLMPVHSLAVFISVLMACIRLKTHSSNYLTTLNLSPNFNKEYAKELEVINSRYPELVSQYREVAHNLEKKSIQKVTQQLIVIFSEVDADIDDLISWSYQYLKKDYEKTAFKNVTQAKSKLANQDLLFTTQFFTDKYMVRYLVEDALFTLSKNNIKDLVLIDPAVGGGNFLTYAFEKLFHIYHDTYPKWSKRKIVDFILNEVIIGYDLDGSLSQIASLSLFVKACDYARPSDTTNIYLFGGVQGDKFGFLAKEPISEPIRGMTFTKRISSISRRKKLFLTNPPFMGKRDMDIVLKDWLQNHYPSGKGDLCVSFTLKILNSMNENDVLAVVTQNNWMYLSSFSEYRQAFLQEFTIKECIDLGSKSFKDINGEKTNVALCILVKGSGTTSKFINLKYTDLNQKRNYLLHKIIPDDLVFVVNPKQFKNNPKFEFSYQLSHTFRSISKLTTYSNFAKPMQGTSTGNNKEFVKYAWEVNGNPDWRLVSKGGGFSKWSGLNYYKVLWGKDASCIKSNKGSALRNVDKISSTHIVFSDTGTLGLNVRLLKPGQVFIASGPGIQIKVGDKYSHLAFLNSKVASFLLKLMNPKFTISAGYISRLPVPELILKSKAISKLSETCYKLKESYLSTKLPNIEFQHIDYSAIVNCDEYISSLICIDLTNDYKRLVLEYKIEDEILTCYSFTKSERSEIESIVGESPFSNTENPNFIDINEIDKFIANGLDVNCFWKSRRINGYSVGSESILEGLSYRLHIHPEVLFKFIVKNVNALKSTQSKYYFDLLHKILLKECGVLDVTMYKHKTFDLRRIANLIRKKYSFLSKNESIEYEIGKILSEHHSMSFLSKPLITLDKNTIEIGKNYD